MAVGDSNSFPFIGGVVTEFQVTLDDVTSTSTDAVDVTATVENIGPQDGFGAPDVGLYTDFGGGFQLDAQEGLREGQSFTETVRKTPNRDVTGVSVAIEADRPNNRLPDSPNFSSAVSAPLPSDRPDPVTDFFVDTEDDFIQVGNSTQITATAIVGAGTRRDVTDSVELSVGNTRRAEVTADDTLRGKAGGPVTVVAIGFEDFDGQRDTTAVTVRSAAGDTEPPEPPADPAEFSIVLPQLPLINNDPRILASLTIPQLTDIQETVGSTVPSLEQIGTEVDSAISGPLQQAEDSIVSTVETEVDAIQIPDAPDVPSVDDIVADVETTVVEPLDTAISQVSDDLTTEIDDIVGDVDNALDDTFDDLAQGVQGTVDEIQSVAGDVGDITDDIDNLNDIGTDAVEDAVETGIESVEPTFNDSGLFSDPVGFAVGFVQAASDVLVDPDVAQDLQDKLDER